jgi:hypothetical protein
LREAERVPKEKRHWGALISNDPWGQIGPWHNGNSFKDFAKPIL